MFGRKQAEDCLLGISATWSSVGSHSVARLGGFKFEFVGKNWFGWMEKIWDGLGSVWIFFNC